MSTKPVSRIMPKLTFGELVEKLKKDPKPWKFFNHILAAQGVTYELTEAKHFVLGYISAALYGNRLDALTGQENFEQIKNCSINMHEHDIANVSSVKI